MKKILYIATTADRRERLDGETIKCRLLRDYLKELTNEKVIHVDTDNWKKHVISLVLKIIINYFKCDVIVVSSADRGSHIVLNFFEKIKSKKRLYYFVIGGSLYKNIIENKWNVSTYQRIQQIYVEADSLKNDLNGINIKNVTRLCNFRKVEKFKNNYQKSQKTRFVFFGRVIKEKGIEEAIKLVNRLNKEGYSCTLDIYGQCQSSYLQKLKKQFTKYIEYHGTIEPNNKTEYEILSKYDVFLFPTEYKGECLPGALIDAYISGLAVIASNWEYAKEYINDNENGIIFNYRDYEDMYKKTKELIQSDKISKFKQKSSKMAKKYMINSVLQDFSKEIMKG